MQHQNLLIQQDTAIDQKYSQTNNSQKLILTMSHQVKNYPFKLLFDQFSHVHIEYNNYINQSISSD